MIGKIYYPGENIPRVVIRDCVEIQDDEEDTLFVKDKDGQTMTFIGEYSFWELVDESSEII